MLRSAGTGKNLTSSISMSGVSNIYGNGIQERNFSWRTTRVRRAAPHTPHYTRNAPTYPASISPMTAIDNSSKQTDKDLYKQIYMHLTISHTPKTIANSLVNCCFSSRTLACVILPFENSNTSSLERARHHGSQSVRNATRRRPTSRPSEFADCWMPVIRWFCLH
jgi:hypothetical protein